MQESRLVLAPGTWHLVTSLPLPVSLSLPSVPPCSLPPGPCHCPCRAAQRSAAQCQGAYMLQTGLGRVYIVCLVENPRPPLQSLLPHWKPGRAHIKVPSIRPSIQLVPFRSPPEFPPPNSGTPSSTSTVPARRDPIPTLDEWTTHTLCL